jgi:hypothetical protein
MTETIAPVTTGSSEGAWPEAGFRSAPPIYFMVTFWGESYRRFFLDFPLASLLAPNNIPGLPDLRGSKFLICTSPEDWQALQSEPLMQRLKSYTEPVFLPSVSILGDHKYSRMTRGHRAMANRCYEARARAVYVAVDTIVPDGSLVELDRLSRCGARVVLCTAIRFAMEGVVGDLRARGRMRDNEPLVVGRREAVEIGLRNLHPESLCGNFDAPYFGHLNAAHGTDDVPTCVFWAVPDRSGIVIYTHNWAPFLMDYSAVPAHDPKTLDTMALDGDYIFRNFGDRDIGEAIHVVEDSDSLFLLGLTPKDEMVPSLRADRMKAAPLVGTWIKGLLINQLVHHPTIDPLRRKILPVPVLWHSQDVTENWRAIEAHASGLMQKFTSTSLRIGSWRWLRGRLREGDGMLAATIQFIAVAMYRAHQGLGLAPRGRFAAVQAFLRGEWPDLKRAHPRWADTHGASAILKAALARSLAPALTCSEKIRPLIVPAIWKRSARANWINLGDLSASQSPDIATDATMHPDLWVIELGFADFQLFADRFSVGHASLASKAMVVAIFYDDGTSAPEQRAISVLLKKLSERDRVTITFAGSRLTRLARRLMMWSRDWSARRGVANSAVACSYAVGGVGLSWLANVFSNTVSPTWKPSFTSVTLAIEIASS